MNLPALAIEKRAVTVFVTLLVVVAGLFCYLQLGQLEDPEFTVKTAAIITTYPGASPEQVELEVTDRIETKLQEMTEVKNIYSSSRPGLSIVKVDIKEQYWADKLPQIWDVVRRKCGTSRARFRPGRAGRRSATTTVTFSASFWPSRATATPRPNSNGTSRTCGRN